jgi:DNA (cytosine-5)-methyltransferase 1
VLDLFAGAGGLTLGFHQASGRFEVVSAVESDVAAAATYDRNFGAGTTCVALVEDWLEEQWVPGVHVVIGGPPCQGFSALGKRQADDARNSSWRHYAQAVRDSGALFFVMENVPQFLGSPEYTLLEEQISRGGLLEDYAFEACVLNAADYGSPQARKRAIVIGHRRDLRFPGWPEKSHPGSVHWRTVRDAWDGLPQRIEILSPGARRTTFAGSRLAGPYRSDELHGTRDYEAITRRRFAHIPPGGSRLDLPSELQMQCWKEYARGGSDVMGRLVWNKPSVTLRTEFTKPEKGRFVHPAEDRGISIHEGARIQGFPDDFQFVGSLTAITRQIGNAVPIPLAKALGQVIAAKFV